MEYTDLCVAVLALTPWDPSVGLRFALCAQACSYPPASFPARPFHTFHALATHNHSLQCTFSLWLPF